MKICVDARMWGIKHTGIGRYVENLIDNLPGDVTLIVPPDLKNEPKLAKFTKHYAYFHPYSPGTIMRLARWTANQTIAK